MRIFAHCPLLSAFSQENHTRAFDEFMTYKKRIPVRGAIMLNHAMDSVVLVKGWKKGANWSFPRGKINKDEDDLICAIREVYEETGYDLQAAGAVPANRDVKHISLPIRDQDMRLYVFRDVPMDTFFEPKTRKEISKIQWWRISDLPGYRKNKAQNTDEIAVNANKFYMVAPFLKNLRKWTIEQQRLDSKRASSNQYLSAGISYDEPMTEEDLGAESTQEQMETTPSGIDTLEGATAVLKSLLKVQPPTQGLQVDAIKSPVARDSGSELLALLQGTGTNPLHGISEAPPHTPMDHLSMEAPIPRTPQHQQPRPQHFSNLPAPPPFNVHHEFNAFSYQLPNQLNPLNSGRGYHQNPMQMHSHQSQQQYQHHQQPQQHHQQQQHQQPHTGPQSNYQSQHLVHPQPLPPHVQRAVFNGGPVHSPMVPPVSQSYTPHYNAPVSIAVANPQFPNVHAPMVSQARKPSPSKLNSHSLALLDAFKRRDTAVGEASNVPLGGQVEAPIQQHPHSGPQELPASISQATPVDLLSMFKANDSPSHGQRPTPSSKKPMNEAHKSSLLSLFKSPTLQTTLAHPTATALPTSKTPSAVELSAVEPLSANVATGVAPNSTSKTAKLSQNQVIQEMNPETNLPFRATSILARPPPSAPNSRPQQSPAPKGRHNGQNGKKHATPNKAQPRPTPEKPFQPQILKRPQPGTTESAIVPSSASPLYQLAAQSDSNRTTGPSASPLSYSQPPAATSEQNTRLLSLLDKLPPAPKSVSRTSTIDSTTQTVDQKQNLLSLFGTSPLPTTSAFGTSGNTPPSQAPELVKRQELLSLFGKKSIPTTSPHMTAVQPPAADHKQTLLGMFSKSPMQNETLSRKSTLEPVSRMSTLDPLARTSTLESISPMQATTALRSRVGSLAADSPQRRGSQAQPMSPADKSFLLSYLDNVAKGSQL